MNFKESHGSWYLWLAEFLSAILSLSIYYFTSKLFSTSINQNLLGDGVDYFTYIVINDILFMIPLYFLEGGVRLFKKSIIDDTLSTFLSLGVSKQKIAFIFYSTNLFPLLMRAFLMFSLAFSFFSIDFSFASFIQVVFTNLIFLPLFMGIGLFVIGLVLATGRGAGLTGYLCTILTFFGGGFFPLEVLPDLLIEISRTINPFALFLDLNHEILFERKSLDIFSNLKILAVSTLFFSTGLYAYFYSFELRKKLGKVQLFIR